MPVEKNPFDDQKLAKIRADQEDPLIMYLIVRESLGMGCGKIAAQTAHAALMVLMKYFEHRDFHHLDDIQEAKHMENWIENSFRKVVLRADDKEWEKIREEIDCFVVRDAGLTEVAPNTETIIATWP